MAEAKTAGLAEALARVQAELKPIRRNTEGQVGQRKRKYADLAAVTETVYPLLGKYGLSFSAKPTLRDGRFVLAYKLRHVSGEEDTGDWPLNGGMPQQVGSEITYARRYCLCAITGAVPEGEDDDGDEAQGAPRRDDSWRDQPPVSQPRGGQGNGRPVQDTADVSQWEASAEPVTDADWMSHLVDDLIPAAKDTDTLNQYWADGLAKHAKGELTTAHWEEIKSFIRDCARDIGPAQDTADEPRQLQAVRNDPT